ncbi:MAG TPA: hypothetical protein VFX28_15435 [Methylomirabilota bacterium]|nr:hypothetical protein [Methylomirabilota bacterium]
MGKLTVALGAAAVLGLGAAAAAADEVKSAISATMLLDLTAPRADSRAAAFDESLRRDGPPRAGGTDGEVLPDGSVRYGSVTVTVRNPCPPGTFHDDFKPLPGRRARN